jgi:hypothetical protein
MPTLILRGCSPSGQSCGGFQYPLQVDSEVESPDWADSNSCGRGLHGFLHGCGDGSCSEYYGLDCKWMAIEPDGPVVDLNGKVKFRRGIIRFIGTLAEAASYVVANDPNAKNQAVIGYTSTSGDRGTSTSGDRGTSTSGDRGTSTSGYRGTSISGDGGTSTSGDRGTSISGDGGTSISGYGGTSISGVGGTSTSGDSGTSTSGDSGTSISGYGGTLIIKYWDEKSKRYRVAIAYVGENGIKPNTPYKLDIKGNFTEVVK